MTVTGKWSLCIYVEPRVFYLIFYPCSAEEKWGGGLAADQDLPTTCTKETRSQGWLLWCFSQKISQIPTDLLFCPVPFECLQGCFMYRDVWWSQTPLRCLVLALAVHAVGTGLLLKQGGSTHICKWTWCDLWGRGLILYSQHMKDMWWKCVRQCYLGPDPEGRETPGGV